MSVIYEGEGDIFQSNAQVITVPVNLQGAMGKGLALEFAKRFPNMFEQYRWLCKNKQLTLGEPFLCPDDAGRDILVFPTKDLWRNPSEVEWIEQGLDYIRETYKELGIESLALPALGCGLGELDYLQDVRPVIYRALDDCQLPVEILLGFPGHQW